MKMRLEEIRLESERKYGRTLGIIQKIDDKHPEKTENKLMGIRDILENHINRAW